MQGNNTSKDAKTSEVDSSDSQSIASKIRREEELRKTDTVERTSEFPGSNVCSTSALLFMDDVLGQVCQTPWGESDSRWSGVEAYLEQSVNDSSTLSEMICSPRGSHDDSALHLICRRHPPLHIVQACAEYSPASVQLRNKDEMFPLHVACAEGASEKVINFLAEKYPLAVEAKDIADRVPLHYVFRTCKTLLPNIKSLATQGVVETCDKDGNTPLHLLTMKARDLSVSLPKIETKESKSYKACLDSLINCRPRRSVQFFTALLRCPKWLGEYAVSNFYVKVLLNEATAKRFPTAILMCDVYVQTMLLTSGNLLIVARENKQDASTSTDFDTELKLIGCMWAGIVYFSFREAARIMSAISQGVSTVLISDGWNWFNVIYLGCLYFLAFFVGRDQQLDTEDAIDDSLRILMMVTGGLAWLKYIVLIKATQRSFAIFTIGVLHVLRKLTPFAVMVFLLVGAFAQMYYISFLNTKDCGWTWGSVLFENEPEEINCSFLGAVLSVYNMFIAGELDENYLTYSISTLILSLLFSMVMLLLLLNVLIALVTESYAEVRHKGETVFWIERLRFISEMEMLMAWLSCDCLAVSKLSSCSKQCEERFDGLNGQLGLLWDSMVLPFQWSSRKEREARKQEIRQLWKGPKWIAADPPSSFLWMIFSLFAFPVWVVLGVVTAGVLWPTRIRRFFLCPNIVCDARHDDDAAPPNKRDLRETENAVLDRISRLEADMTVFREDLSEIKAMLSTMMWQARMSNQANLRGETVG